MSDRPTHTMLTPGEAEAMLGVSRRTLMRWEERGIIQARRLPTGHRRFLRADVEALVAAGAA